MASGSGRGALSMSLEGGLDLSPLTGGKSLLQVLDPDFAN